MDLNILKNWKPGDRREITERQLRKLRATDAWDSYTATYRMDGLVWRVVSEMAREDGETVVTLVAEESA